MEIPIYKATKPKPTISFAMILIAENLREAFFFHDILPNFNSMKLFTC